MFIMSNLLPISPSWRCFLLFATFLYSVFTAYRKELTCSKIENTIDFVLWLLFLIILAYTGIYMGPRVTNLGYKFAVHVGKYANQCDDEVSCRKVKNLRVNILIELLQINLLLSKAARNRKPFLNCGFFNIDFTLKTLLSRQLKRTWSSLRNLRRTLMSMHNFLNSANELHI